MSRRTMDNQTIEEHIETAVVQLRDSRGTAAEADELWKVPVERARGDEWYLKDTGVYSGAKGGRRKTVTIDIYRLALTAAAVVLVFLSLSYYQFLVRVDARVYLDVNPSVTFSVNRMGRVISAEANNKDAEAVLGELDLKGKETEEAMEILLSAMRSQGYIPKGEGTVLVSLECGNNSRRANLAEDLKDEVGEYLKAEAGGGTVYCQTLETNDEILEFAKEHSISAGKAALVLKLAQEHTELNADHLASLSMRELVRYLRSQNIDLRDTLDYVGDDIDEEGDTEDAAPAVVEEPVEEPAAAQKVTEQNDADDDDDDDHDDDEDGDEDDEDDADHEEEDSEDSNDGDGDEDDSDHEDEREEEDGDDDDDEE